MKIARLFTMLVLFLLIACQQTTLSTPIPTGSQTVVPPTHTAQQIVKLTQPPTASQTAVLPTKSPLPVPTQLPTTVPQPLPSPTSTAITLSSVFSQTVLSSTTILNEPPDIAPLSQTTENVQVVNGLLYLTLNNELLIFDPDNLVEPVGRLAFGQRFADDLSRAMHYDFARLGLAVQNNIVYVLDDQLYAVDVSIPSQPVVIGSVPAAGLRMVANGRFIYLLDLLAVTVVNIANPANPQLVETFNVHAVADFGTYLVEIAAFSSNDQTILFLAGQSNGVIGLDVSNLAQISRLDWVFPTELFVNTLLVHNNRLYAANIDGALWTFDLTNPTQPKLLGKTEAVDVMAVWGMHVTDEGSLFTVGSGSNPNDRLLNWYLLDETGLPIQQGSGLVVPSNSSPGSSSEMSLGSDGTNLYIGGMGGLQIVPRAAFDQSLP